MRKIILVAVSLMVIGLGVYYYQHPRITFIKSTFSELPHWQDDNQAEALLAFKKSCTEIVKRHTVGDFGGILAAGKVRDWQTICTASLTIPTLNNQIARQFFEEWFQPYYIKANFSGNGLFTGYYLPLLHANLQKDKDYSVPIYGLPNDLIQLNLSAFNPHNENKIIIGQLTKNNILRPYPTRDRINQGINAPVLVWGDNLIDVFFAQIQGSALVELPNKQHLLLGYAGTNGRSYTAIGKILIMNKAIQKTDISMQTIRTWLIQHPEQINAILDANASYVFFKILKNADPVGSEGIPLTAQRSLAVDKNYVPLGAPVWLTVGNVPSPEAKETHFQHLVIAQDTGGAIKGAIRGDIYWGAGETAAFIAGHMQSQGHYWILLPRKIT